MINETKESAIKKKFISIYENILLIKLSIYSFITSTYFYILKINNINNFKWNEVHETHMMRSIEHILNNSVILKSGFTSWSIYKPYIPEIDNEEIRNFYPVEIYHHLHHLFINFVGGWQLVKKIGPIIDNILVISTAVILSEIFIKFLFDRDKEKSFNYFFSGIFFILFISSPWVTAMLMGSWWEVSFLFFYSISSYLFLNKKSNLALFFYLIACFSSYFWGFAFSLINLFILITFLLGKKSFIKKYFPLKIYMYKFKYLFWVFIGFIPFILMSLRKLVFSIFYSNITLHGSSFATRVGLKTGEMHGGFLPIFQFIGGIKLSTCFNTFDDINNTLSKLKIISNFSNVTSNLHNIYLCGLSILGMSIISLIAIFGYLKAINSSKYRNIQWLMTPLPLSYILMAAVFQQSFGIHNQGYTYLFSFIFATGITYLSYLLIKKINSPFKWLYLFVFLFPILLTNLKISSLWSISLMRQSI